MPGSRIAMVVLTLALSAQTTPPASPPPATPPVPQAPTSGLELSRQGRYLGAVDLFHAAAFAADGTILDPAAFQYWAQTSSFITSELPLHVYDARNTIAPDPSWARRLAAATPRDAIAEIVRRARTTSIVVLNEAHVSPRDRAFALQVARALRPLGYTTLAAEAFTPEGIPELRRDGFVRRSLGFYTRDPVYAGFVRKAMALGYRPVAYEITPDQTARGIDREEAQARNLIATTLAADPKAKLFVYVGHAHVSEERVPGGKQRMAAWLKQLTGTDPLTIDQSIVKDIYPAYRPAYDAAAARLGSRSAVFLENGHPVTINLTPQDVDIQVIHPRRAYRHGRPSWLAAFGGQPLAIPRNLLPTRGRALIQAFAADAPPDAVPLDQVLVTAGTPPPMLLVPTKNVRFAVQTAD